MKKQYFYFLLALGLASSARSQTLVDLRTQSKSVDFSALPSTRPVQVGTTLPGTCQVGQLFFKSDAVAGSNLYGCTAANTWSVQANGSSGSGGGSGSGATMASQLGDLQPVRTSSNVLTIGSGCSATTPCNVRFGSTSYSITSPATGDFVRIFDGHALYLRGKHRGLDDRAQPRGDLQWMRFSIGCHVLSFRLDPSCYLDSVQWHPRHRG